jgi:succinate dehydrogenase hydrophobic anchor subunit
MPVEETEEITKKRLPGKNLKNALLALGYFILASLTEFLMIDLIYPRHSKILVWLLACLYLILFIVSGIYALISISGAIRSQKDKKDIRNYIAIVISGLVVLFLCIVIFDVLY